MNGNYDYLYKNTKLGNFSQQTAEHNHSPKLLIDMQECITCTKRYYGHNHENLLLLV